MIHAFIPGTPIPQGSVTWQVDDGLDSDQQADYALIGGPK